MGRCSTSEHVSSKTVLPKVVVVTQLAYAPLRVRERGKPCPNQHLCSSQRTHRSLVITALRITAHVFLHNEFNVDNLFSLLL